MARIEAEYGGETGRRLIVGWSFGGLFRLYTLFHRPELFNDYLALSSSLWWDEAVAFNYVERYAEAHTSLPARLFLSVGNEEGGSMVTNVEKLKAILARRAYDRLRTKTMVIEAETHLSVVAGSFSKGIRWALAGDGEGD